MITENRGPLSLDPISTDRLKDLTDVDKWSSSKLLCWGKVSLGLDCMCAVGMDQKQYYKGILCVNIYIGSINIQYKN